MQVVRGRFRNGVVEPLEPVDAPEGSDVELRFLDGATVSDADAAYDEAAARLIALLEASAISTGIEDLAEQHDHYIHGTPKRAA